MSKVKESDSLQFKGISYSTTLGAAVAAAAGAGPALAQDDRSIGIEEITVTASKRGAMSIQDFAGSIQAFDTEAIRNQNLFNMEDYTKVTPSLSYFGNATGQGKIYFRGIADAPDSFIAAASAAVYIDEQPVTQGAQPDVRLVDIERVEALSGPQGTLYGSSSQSGTLRIVTNKPDPTKFESFVDASLKGMSEGDTSYDISAMVNIPLSENQLALRLVGFSASEGGFVDNVLGTTASCESEFRCDVNGAQLNTSAVEEDWNETSLSGGRAGLKWFINDDWSVLASIAHQKVDADAENTYDPTVGDLQTINFFPDTFDDDWTQYALTIEGSFGNLNFMSATSYFERESQYVQDTTAYAAYFGSFCYEGTASYNIYCFQPAGVNYAYSDPIGFLVNDQENISFSQEFRLSYTGDKISWVTGVFWEDRDEEWVFDTFTTNNGGYSESQGWENWDTYWNVSPPETDAWWRSSDDTNWRTTAVFGEATFQWTDRLSVTAGARWFEVDQKKDYFVELPQGRRTPATVYLNGSGVDKHGCLLTDAPCQGGPFVDAEGETTGDSDNPDDDGVSRLDSKDDDTALKLSVQYDISDDKMIYALFSEGYRAGGNNRSRGNPRLPRAYTADFLTNYEIGLKSQWADGRVQINAVAFFQDWEDYQLEVVDPSNVPCSEDPTPPCGQPWQKVVTNAGNASSDGIEIAFEALPTDRLTLRGNMTFLDTEITAENPIIEDVPVGAKLPFAPEFKGSFYAQYNWPVTMVGASEAFFQFQYSHVGDSVNQVQVIPAETGVVNAPQITMEAWDYASVKFGLVGDNWEVVFFHSCFSSGSMSSLRFLSRRICSS